MQLGVGEAERVATPKRDSLALAIITTAVALTVLTLAGLPIFGSAFFGFRETTPLEQLPWTLPVAQAFVVLSALAIASLCLGRFLSLGGVWAYWSGVVFLASGVLGFFYLLSWPGLLGDHGLVGTRSNTASWYFFMTYSSLALLALTPVSYPKLQLSSPLGAYAGYSLAGLIALSIGLLSVWFEGALPTLVVGLVFTPLTLIWTGLLVVLMGIAAVFAYRRYRQGRDVMLGYLALFLLLMAYGLLYSVTGGKRYDIWWYASRVLFVLAHVALLLGLLQEGYALFGRERLRFEERARLLGEIEQLALLAQRRAGELAAVVESMADAVFVCDAQGRISLSNAVGLALLGRQSEAMPGTLADFLAALRPRFADGRAVPVAELAITRALRRGEVVRGQTQWVTHPLTRQRVDLYVSAAPLRDDAGQVVGAVEVAADITRLRELQERQREFVSLISHDLRSPLTNVQGMGQLLARDLGRKGLAAEQRGAEAVVKSARRMESMLTDLVESANWEAGQVELRTEPTDLVQLVADLVERVGVPEDRHRIQVVAPEPLPMVLADRSRLDRAVTNLLTNALKYSPADKPVVVRLEQRDGMAVLSVSDQGVGIPEADLGRVFERYFRSSTAGQREGLGLGLYITSLIAQAHGGQITVASKVGEGSTFSLILPFGPKARR
ncbi:MAG: ATP-binding protein [Chloroflexota bacterium]